MKPTEPTFQTPQRIAIVGEAPGAEEELQGRAFVGAAGAALTDCLTSAGIPREGCFITNVFNERPPGNDVSSFTLKKKAFDKECAGQLEKALELPPGVQEDHIATVHKAQSLPRLGTAMYIRPDKVWHLHRLAQELASFDPVIIIAVGNTALWALCQVTGITKHRGAVHACVLPGLRDVKVLPTFHTAAMLREWSLRPIIIADLLKARVESKTREFKADVERFIYLDPSIQDIWDFHEWFISDCEVLSVDIETAKYEFITCIGLAPRPDRVLVIPFVDRNKPGYHYWETEREELLAWDYLSFAFSPTQPYMVLGQNFTYDIQYLMEHCIFPVKYNLDTMLHHHALFPELPKSLGFMGSIYTNEISWKTMRQSGTEKREE